MTPLVSILCPAYNHAAFIGRSIQSVLEQTYPHWELILVDDASSDNSYELALAFAQKDARLRVFKNTSNLGISKTLEVAYKKATGQYFAFLASDDAYVANKLEVQLEALKANPSAQMVFALPWIIDETDKVYEVGEHPAYSIFQYHPNRSRAEHLRHFFLHGNYLQAISAFIKREALESLEQPFDPLFLQLEDFERYVRLLLRHEAVFLADRLVYYRILADGQNLSSASPKTQMRHHWEYSRLLGHFNLPPATDLLLEAFPEFKTQNKALDEVGLTFQLALLAWQQGEHLSHKLFALNQLASLMARPSVAAQLQEVFAFTYGAYHNMVQQADFFQIQWHYQLQAQEQDKAKVKKLSSLRLNKTYRLHLNLVKN